MPCRQQIYKVVKSFVSFVQFLQGKNQKAEAVFGFMPLWLWKKMQMVIVWHKKGVSHQQPTPVEDKENLLTSPQISSLKPELCLL